MEDTDKQPVLTIRMKTCFANSSISQVENVTPQTHLLLLFYYFCFYLFTCSFMKRWYIGDLRHWGLGIFLAKVQSDWTAKRTRLECQWNQWGANFDVTVPLISRKNIWMNENVWTINGRVEVTKMSNLPGWSFGKLKIYGNIHWLTLLYTTL